jgi:hypothetical protein
MKNILSPALACLLLFCPALALAQSFSADDFLPPAQAATPTDEAALRQVQAPGEVKTETGAVSGQPAITAASPQDAINAYLAQRSAGFTELQFPSGFGFAATGVATYAKHESVVAARIDQRNAYNRAYTQAKKNLAQGLYGLSNEGRTKIAEAMSNIDEAAQGTLTRAETLTSESIRQSVEGLLRGYVVYDVFDDFENTAVYVTIVTTPKTQGHYERPAAGAVAAASVKEGLDQVLAEVKKGLVPPVGGRTVFVPATGELAFIGFGSAVVRVDQDKALQAKHNLNAERTAGLRAGDALLGIISGDAITGLDKLDSETKDLLADYEETTRDDPLAKPAADSGSYKILSERKKEFLSLESSSSTVSSLRKGVVPPGVRTQGWRDSDNAFAYALSVYLPSATARADQARQSMQQGQIVQSPGGKAAAGSPPPPEAGILNQGPSGRVQGDEAL